MSSAFTDLSSTNGKSNIREAIHDVSTLRKKLNEKRSRLVPLELAKVPFESKSSKFKRIYHKKDLVEAVRRVSTPCSALIKTPSMHQKHGSASVINTNIIPETAEGASKEVESLEDGVNMNARKYNDHKRAAEKKQQELNQLKDEIHSLSLETEILEKMSNNETPNGQRIFQLKDNIEQCLVSIEDRMHERRQLEHMIRRLQNNEVKFSAHLYNLEQTMNVSESEFSEVKLLLRELEAGKSRAVHFVQECQNKLQMERKKRTREMNEKEAEAIHAQRMEQWRLKRIQQRKELAAELRGDLSENEENVLLKRLDECKLTSEALQLDNKEQTLKAAELECFFTQLKQATGANSLEDIVKKFEGQKLNKQGLEKEKLEVEQKLIQVKALKEQVLTQFNEMKASGIEGLEVNREAYDRLDQEVIHAKSSLKVYRAASESLKGVLASVRQGSNALQQKLECFDELSDAQEENSLITTGNEVGDSLALSELKLSKMLEIIGQQSGTNVGFNGFSGDGEDLFNEESRKQEKENGINNDSAHSDGFLTDSNVRVYANEAQKFEMIMTARSDESNLSIETTSNSNGSKGHEDIVPDRLSIKKSSHREYAEIIRKREMAEKRKAIVERGVTEIPSEVSKKRAQVLHAYKDNVFLFQFMWYQDESNRRLSMRPQGIIQGMSSKDDALTRSQAFLTQVPDLT